MQIALVEHGGMERRKRRIQFRSKIYIFHRLALGIEILVAIIAVLLVWGGLPHA